MTEATLAAAGMPESTFLWWDVRLHPRYGTVEVREMDAQASLDDVAALAALVRALVLAAADARAGRRRAERGARLVELPRRPRRHRGRDPRRRRPAAARRGRARDGGARAAVRPGARRRGCARRDRAHPRAGRGRGPPAACACAGRVPRGARDARRGHGGGPPAPLERASRLWLDARSERDLERLAALTARDAVWTSPVDGTSSGRDAVVEHVEAGFRDADAFSTELLAYEARGNRAVARIRNVAARNGAELDSLQALVFEEAGGLVSSISVHVDDLDAVEAFWEDDA